MNLKKIRIYEDITQQEMADKIGISRSSYGMWEQEREFVPLKYLIIISDKFNYSLDYILGLTENLRYENSLKGLDRQTLAKRIKLIRRINDVTQETLAHILNVSISSISKYESGTNLPLTSYLIGFCNYFNISCDYLTGKIEEKIEVEKKVKVQN